MSYGLKSVTKQCTKKILEQMENSFYEVYIKEEESLIGIFCSIKNKDKNIPVIIINKYINLVNIGGTIKISINNDCKILKLGDVKYHNKEYNISLLEVIENKDVNINYHIYYK